MDRSYPRSKARPEAVRHLRHSCRVGGIADRLRAADLAHGRSAVRQSPQPYRFPLSLRRLYIARDADAAGDAVVAVLTQRAKAAGIEAITLSPRLGDFNEDLHIFGLDALRAAMRIQLVPEESSASCIRRLPSHRARGWIDVDRSAGRAPVGLGRAHGLLEGDRTASGPGRQWLRPAIFRRAPTT